MEIKVNNIVQHTKWKMLVNPHPNDIPNTVPVVEGTFLLVEYDTSKLLKNDSEKLSILYINSVSVLPIIISETEKFDSDEPVLCLDEIEYGWEEAYLKNGRGEGTCTLCRKILAMPEHFSPHHIQLILDGKLKSGDKVLLECQCYDERWTSLNTKVEYYKVKNHPHIILHLLESVEKAEPKMYTKEQMIWAYEQGVIDGCDPDCKDTNGEKWFETNVK